MMRTIPLWLLVMALAAGCQTDAPAPPGDPPPADTTTAAPTRIDTIYVEGTAMPVELHRFDEAAWPFVTYLPPGDFLPQITELPEGHGVRLVANFGGVESPDAYAEFFFPLEAALTDSLGALAAYAEEAIERNGWRLGQREAGCDWAERTLGFEDDTGPAPAIGYVCLGEHGDEPFYLLVHYPREYAEGFTPRLGMVLDAFRWRDTGQRLGR